MKGVRIMKINTVNETFFETKLLQSQFDLKNPELLERDKLDIMLMQQSFKEYIGIAEEKKSTKIMTVDQMLDRISNKLNKYLETFSVEECEKIQSLCWNVRKYKCPKSGKCIIKDL